LRTVFAAAMEMAPPPNSRRLITNEPPLISGVTAAWLGIQRGPVA
jgi:hypothetical protein